MGEKLENIFQKIFQWLAPNITCLRIKLTRLLDNLLRGEKLSFWGEGAGLRIRLKLNALNTTSFVILLLACACAFNKFYSIVLATDLGLYGWSKVNPKRSKSKNRSCWSKALRQLIKERKLISKLKSLG